jgi:hypothetical protein
VRERIDGSTRVTRRHLVARVARSGLLLSAVVSDWVRFVAVALGATRWKRSAWPIGGSRTGFATGGCTD